jgi:hypothetical protein
MSWLAFIASVIKSLAWPVAVVIIVFFMRVRLAALIGGLTARLANLSKLTAPGLALEFEKGTEEVSRAAEQLTGATRTEAPTKSESEERARLQQLAEVEPKAAVIMAFIDVEAALRSAADRALGLSGRKLSTLAITNMMVLRGILTVEAGGVLSDLSSLRNQAAHQADIRIGVESAQQYIDAAAEMVRHLDGIGPDTEPSFDESA